MKKKRGFWFNEDIAIAYMSLKSEGGFKVTVWLLETSFRILRVNVGLGYPG